MTLTTALNEGGFEYTHDITLTETGGAQANITRIAFASFVGDRYYAETDWIDEAEIWVGGAARVAANGTLRSRPLVISDPDPTEYADNVLALVKYTSSTDTTEKDLLLSADGGPMPMPPAGSKFSLTGVSRESAGNATVRDVRIEISSGPNTGRNTKTDRTGKYTLPNLGPGTITVKASKSGYEPMTETLLFLSNKPLDFRLTKVGASGASAAPLDHHPVKRLRVTPR